MKNASLVIVGSGIKFKSHLTAETIAYIEQSDVVLYSVNEPAMRDWIQKINPRAESLDDFYNKHELRLDCYKSMTSYILESLRKKQHVCVILYGHPIIYAQPALNAVLQAREEGYYAKVLPGISAEDCLFADLLIDPGSCGCQSYEATDFLIHRRCFDRASHLILWQVGFIGALGHPIDQNNVKGIRVLSSYLSKFYNLDHEVIIYEAAQYPCFEPSIMRMHLKHLSEKKISNISTLYVPPAYKADCDQDMLDALNISLVDLQ